MGTNLEQRLKYCLSRPVNEDTAKMLEGIKYTLVQQAYNDGASFGTYCDRFIAMSNSREKKKTVLKERIVNCITARVIYEYDRELAARYVSTLPSIFRNFVAKIVYSDAEKGTRYIDDMVSNLGLNIEKYFTQKTLMHELGRKMKIRESTLEELVKERDFSWAIGEREFNTLRELSSDEEFLSFKEDFDNLMTDTNLSDFERNVNMFYMKAKRSAYNRIILPFIALSFTHTGLFYGLAPVIKGAIMMTTPYVALKGVQKVLDRRKDRIKLKHGFSRAAARVFGSLFRGVYVFNHKLNNAINNSLDAGWEKMGYKQRLIWRKILDAKNNGIIDIPFTSYYIDLSGMSRKGIKKKATRKDVCKSISEFIPWLRNLGYFDEDVIKRHEIYAKDEDFIAVGNWNLIKRGGGRTTEGINTTLGAYVFVKVKKEGILKDMNIFHRLYDFEDFVEKAYVRGTLIRKLEKAAENPSKYGLKKRQIRRAINILEKRDDPLDSGYRHLDRLKNSDQRKVKIRECLRKLKNGNLSGLEREVILSELEQMKEEVRKEARSIHINRRVFEKIKGISLEKAEDVGV